MLWYGKYLVLEDNTCAFISFWEYYIAKYRSWHKDMYKDYIKNIEYKLKGDEQEPKKNHAARLTEDLDIKGIPNNSLWG